jgi:hypothetical protein
VSSDLLDGTRHTDLGEGDGKGDVCTPVDTMEDFAVLDSANEG